jgi:hypothetical protein
MYVDKKLQLESGATLRVNGSISPVILTGDDAQAHVSYGAKAAVVIAVTEAFNTMTSIQIDLVTADNAALTTNPVVLASTGAVPLSEVNAVGRELVMPLPDNAPRIRANTGLRYTVVGTPPTTGKVQANIVPDYRTVARTAAGVPFHRK